MTRPTIFSLVIGVPLSDLEVERLIVANDSTAQVRHDNDGFRELVVTHPDGEIDIPTYPFALGDTGFSIEYYGATFDDQYRAYLVVTGTTYHNDVNADQECHGLIGPIAPEIAGKFALQTLIPGAIPAQYWTISCEA